MGLELQGGWEIGAGEGWKNGLTGATNKRGGVMRFVQHEFITLSSLGLIYCL